MMMLVLIITQHETTRLDYLLMYKTKLYFHAYKAHIPNF